MKSWLGHSLCLSCRELHYLSGHVLKGARGQEQALRLMGLRGLGITLSPAAFPVLAQRRAKEKTQDGPMLQTGRVSHGCGHGAGNLPETVVGRSLESQHKAQESQGAPSVGLVREISVPRGNF